MGFYKGYYIPGIAVDRLEVYEIISYKLYKDRLCQGLFKSIFLHYLFQSFKGSQIIGILMNTCIYIM